MNIRSKDLNLLSIFVAISEELNLSKVSQRLGLSQPALSHALARLRDQFADPLFVRSPRGLVATPKVAILLPQIRELLAVADKLYRSDETLDLGKLERKVVIASTEYVEMRLMPGFIRETAANAPGLEIETRSLRGEFPKQELESGGMDLAIAAYFEDVPSDFRIEPIFSESFVCVCSRKNRYLRTGCAIADYLECRHLQINVPSGVFVPADQYLRSLKVKRKIALNIGNFLTPPVILADSDLLLTCPRSLAESYCSQRPLTISELPFAIPAIETRMVWHARYQNDPFHSWLRGCWRKLS